MNPRSHIRVALTGNPRSGKTTLFRHLTGERPAGEQDPGLTIETTTGHCEYGGVRISLADLPGTYSLTPYSAQESATRDVILGERPDVVIHVLDASHIERHLYLGVQLMELGVPLVFALNMCDVAAAQGVTFDLPKLSRFLGGPVVPTVATRRESLEPLLQAVVEMTRDPGRYAAPRIGYGHEIDTQLDRLGQILERTGSLPPGLSPRWTALKLLEGDPWVTEQVPCDAVHDAVRQAVAQIQRTGGETPATLIADRRYGFISGACQEAVLSTAELRHLWSDRLDVVVLSPLLGLPLFLALMYLVFQLTFAVGTVPMHWLENAFGWLAASIAAAWPGGTASPLCSLIVDGIIGGVGGVLAFVPNILLLFLGIAVLEDSGYMARAAFIMDGIMHRMGLHGKSFLPMIIGFGCTVPAILATRTLDNRRDRLTTILIAPLMSCGARLPVYSLIIPAFFPPRWQGPVLWLVYVTGIGLAVVCARLLRSTVLRGPTMPLVMELPPYRAPTLRGCLVHTWERTGLYVRKAGTVILGFSIVLWALAAHPKKKTFDRDYAAELSAAVAARDAKAAELGRTFGVPVAPDTIERRLAAAPARDAAMPARPGASADRLADMCAAVVAVRGRFARHVRSASDGGPSPDTLYLEERRDAELRQLRDGDAVLYDAAVAYLDRARAPAEATRRTLAAAKKAEELDYSMIGRIGHTLEPLLRPLGFDWRVGTALIGALAGKELFVAQLGIVFAVGQDDVDGQALRQKLRDAYTPLTGLCVMLFCLVSAPCIATLAATRREAGGWRWALLQTCGLTAMAYVLTLIVFQTGRLLGLGA